MRVIAVTGYGQEVDRAASRAAGFGAHLVKPAQADCLLGLLAEQARPDANAESRPSDVSSTASA